MKRATLVVIVCFGALPIPLLPATETKDVVETSGWSLPALWQLRNWSVSQTRAGSSINYRDRSRSETGSTRIFAPPVCPSKLSGLR